MWALRLLAVLTVVGVVTGALLSLLTRNPVYLGFAWRLFRYAMIVALLILALLILERVAVMIL